MKVIRLRQSEIFLPLIQLFIVFTMLIFIYNTDSKSYFFDFMFFKHDVFLAVLIWIFILYALYQFKVFWGYRKISYNNNQIIFNSFADKNLVLNWEDLKSWNFDEYTLFNLKHNRILIRLKNKTIKLNGHQYQKNELYDLISFLKEKKTPHNL